MCNCSLSIAVLQTDPWPSMVSWMVVLPQIRNPTKTWQDNRPLHWSPRQQQIKLNQSVNCGRFAWTCLPLWCKADYQTKTLQAVNYIQILVTAHWRSRAEYIGLEETTLERCSHYCRVQGDSHWVALSLTLSPKNQFVSTSLMRNGASWMHRDTGHIN